MRRFVVQLDTVEVRDGGSDRRSQLDGAGGKVKVVADCAWLADLLTGHLCDSLRVAPRAVSRLMPRPLILTDACVAVKFVSRKIGVIAAVIFLEAVVCALEPGCGDLARGGVPSSAFATSGCRRHGAAVAEALIGEAPVTRFARLEPGLGQTEGAVEHSRP